MNIPVHISPPERETIHRKMRVIAKRLGPVASTLKEDGFDVEFVANDLGDRITMSVIVTITTPVEAGAL